jgi:hypothetical protein
MSIHLSMNQVAQTLHVFIGVVFVTLPVCWGWSHAQMIGSLVGVVYALLKEFIFDLEFEDEMTSGGFSGSCEDFAYYLVGIGIANLLLLF